MELHIGDRRISADVVEARHASLATHLMDEFGLPEEHRVTLILSRFFLSKRTHPVQNVL